MTKKKWMAVIVALLFAAALIWRLCFSAEEATVDDAPLAVTVQRVATRDVAVPMSIAAAFTFPARRKAGDAIVLAAAMESLSKRLVVVRTMVSRCAEAHPLA